MKKTFLSAFMLLFVFITTLTIEAKVTNLDEKIPLSPKVVTGKLANGLTYFVIENKKPEKRAEIQIVFRAGSVQEDDNQRGLAHFLEHMCFNGTKHFPKDSLVKFLEATGVRFGADLNANTGFDRTYYMITIPLDKSGMLEQGIQVLDDWAMGVTMDSIEIEKERGVILEEKRLRGGAASRVMEKHFAVMFKGSKYAHRMPIGTEEIIKTAPRKAFLDYYNDWYRPDLTAVIIVGDVKTNDAVKLIKKHFEKFQYRGKSPERPKGTYPVPNNQEPLVSIAYDKELQQSDIALYIKHPKRDDYTYRTYRENIKDGLFSQMFSLRLQELGKSANPPFLGAMGGSMSFMADLRCLILSTMPKSGELQKGFEASLAELFRIDQNGFTESELKRAKESVLANMEKAYNDREKQESSPLAQELARYFDEGESMPGIEKEYELTKEFLNDITLAEINKMSTELITNNNVVITVSLPESSPEKPTESTILDIYNKAKSEKYKPYVDEIGDKPLMAKKPTAGKITSTKKLPNFDITEMKLSNGARVLLKPTDFKNDQIMFQCWAEGGASQYKSLIDFRTAGDAAGIIDECGLGEFNSISLQKKLQGKMVSVAPFITDYMQGMRGSTTPKDMETFFQILNMQFTQTREDAEAFKSWLVKTSEMLKTRDRDPNNVLFDTLSAVLNNYDKRMMPMTEKELNDINLSNAAKIYKERFEDAANFTFLFVGAFNVDQIKPYIEQYVASLPNTNKKEKIIDLGINVPSGRIDKIVKKGIEPKATVRIVIKDNEPFEYTSENILKANILADLLSRNLRESLREEKGGIYTIGARPQIKNIPASTIQYAISFSCDPTRVNELTKGVEEVLADMMLKEPQKEYLAAAKEVLKKEYEKNIKENGYWFNVIQSYDYTKRDLSFIKDYEKNLNKITGKDLQNAAKTFFDYKKNLIKVILMPED